MRWVRKDFRMKVFLKKEELELDLYKVNKRFEGDRVLLVDVFF